MNCVDLYSWSLENGDSVGAREVVCVVAVNVIPRSKHAPDDPRETCKPK